MSSNTIDHVHHSIVWQLQGPLTSPTTACGLSWLLCCVSKPRAAPHHTAHKPHAHEQARHTRSCDTCTPAECTLATTMCSSQAAERHMATIGMQNAWLNPRQLARPRPLLIYQSRQTTDVQTAQSHPKQASAFLCTASGVLPQAGGFNTWLCMHAWHCIATHQHCQWS